MPVFAKPCLGLDPRDHAPTKLQRNADSKNRHDGLGRHRARSSHPGKVREASLVIYDVAIKIGFWTLGAAALVFLALMLLTNTHP
jgi:hypothetical protein